MDPYIKICSSAAEILKDRQARIEAENLETKHDSTLIIGLKLLAKGHGFDVNKPLSLIVADIPKIERLLSLKFNSQNVILVKDDSITETIEFIANNGDKVSIFNRTTLPSI
jgi:hypothetical protein